MPFQCFYQGREKGNEPLGADAVSGMPDQEQRVLDLWSIAAQMEAPMPLLHLFGMVEQPPRIFAHIAGGCDKGLVDG